MQFQPCANLYLVLYYLLEEDSSRLLCRIREHDSVVLGSPAVRDSSGPEELPCLFRETEYS
jgi:hypothetical protein